MSNTICDESRVRIIRGEDRDLILRLTVRETGDPFTLTGVAVGDIIAKFKNADDSCLEITGSPGITINSIEGGKITVTLTAAQTALLQLGEQLSFEVAITKSAKVSIAQFVGVLDVIDSVCA